MKSKKCTKCRVEKGRAEFSRRGEGLQSWCRACHRAHDRDLYRDSPARRAAVAATRTRFNAEHVERNRQFLLAYFTTHPCVDCGEADAAVLEFDHVRGTKTANVSELMGLSGKALEEEIAKCDVRCGNCHRRRTARERNHWIWRASERRRKGVEWPR